MKSSANVVSKSGILFTSAVDKRRQDISVNNRYQVRLHPVKISIVIKVIVDSLVYCTDKVYNTKGNKCFTES